MQRRCNACPCIASAVQGASAVLDASAVFSPTFAGIVQGVGKSCLVLRYVRGQFDPASKITVRTLHARLTLVLPREA